jgi:hypothetical protein
VNVPRAILKELAWPPQTSCNTPEFAPQRVRRAKVVGSIGPRFRPTAVHAETIANQDGVIRHCRSLFRPDLV